MRARTNQKKWAKKVDFIGLSAALMPIAFSIPDRPDVALRTHRLTNKQVKECQSQWLGLRRSCQCSNAPSWLASLSRRVAPQHPSALRPVNTIPFHPSCSPAHVSRGSQNDDCSSYCDFPSHCLTVTCAHTVRVARCRPGSLVSLLHSGASSRSSSPVLRSLHCLCDRSDRLYNMSLWIYLTFNI